MTIDHENPVVYETPVMRIGKHNWKLQVYRNQYYSNCTRYMWQRIETYGKQSWNADKDWPTYDDHDGCYGGMPISLIKIYNRFEREIKNALNGTNELEPQQVMELI